MSAHRFALAQLRKAGRLNGRQDDDEWLAAVADYSPQHVRAAVRAFVDSGPRGSVNAAGFRRWLHSREDWLLPPSEDLAGPERRPRSSRRSEGATVAVPRAELRELLESCDAAHGRHPVYGPGRCAYCAGAPAVGHLPECVIPWLAKLLGDKPRKVRDPSWEGLRYSGELRGEE